VEANRLTQTCLILPSKWKVLLLLLHPFNGLFSRTTWVSRHKKGKPFWILQQQEMMGWHWHQMDQSELKVISTKPETAHLWTIRAQPDQMLDRPS